MCVRNSESESCEVAKNLAALGVRVNAVEEKQTALETTVTEMRKESQSGFKQLSSAINALGHDFGDRMNIIEKKVVDEKAKHDERVDANRLAWHDTLRKVVTWTATVVLSGASVAMGVSIYKNIFVK